MPRSRPVRGYDGNMAAPVDDRFDPFGDATPAAVEPERPDDPFVPIVRSDSIGEIAFLDGLLAESGLPYHAADAGVSGVSMEVETLTTFLVPASRLHEARDVLMEGIATIPDLRLRVEEVSGGQPAIETAPDDSTAAATLVARGFVAALFVIVVGTMIARVLATM